MNDIEVKKKGKLIPRIIFAAAIFGILCAVAVWGTAWYRAKSDNSGDKDTTVATEETNDGIDAADQAGQLPQTIEHVSTEDVSEIAEAVMPAIVAIRCQVVKKTVNYDFFGIPYENEQAGESAGTGIIIAQGDQELLIATNNHVVESATSITIDFADGTNAKAELRGAEEARDLAVVSVRLADMKQQTFSSIRIASLGSSESLKAGDMVVAIGNALGYGQSVTVGYVSAVDRSVTVEGVTADDLIQVDAAINPGNSGGALLNASGQVVGINSAKYSSVQVERVGYAIPIDNAIPIVNDLITREELSDDEKGYLGISGMNIDKNRAASFQMPIGVYVSEVGKNTPAAAAGLHKGDIIVGMNDRTIETMADLQKILGYTRSGTEVTLKLKVLTNGAYVDKEVKVILGNHKN